MHLRNGPQWRAPSRVVTACGELVTTSAKLEAAMWTPIATSNFFKRHSSNRRAAEVAVKEYMKSNFQNHIKTGFDQVKQSTKAYQLKTKSDISSLGTVMMKDIHRTCARASENFDKVRQDVPGSGGGQSSQRAISKNL